jgi:glucokinase
LKSIHGEKVDGLLLDSEFDKGNDMALKIYEYTGQKLGQGLAQAATLLSPQAFIFYGGFSNAGERILDPAKRSMDRHLINGHAGKIDLLRSGLPQGQAGILGAASLIWAP